MARHQERLHVQTFMLHELIIKTDFAATAELKQKFRRTCEHGTSASQCVAIVLHSPGMCNPSAGEERLVSTDYWRAWSSAKPSHTFHQKLMDVIIKHYKVGAVAVAVAVAAAVAVAVAVAVAAYTRHDFFRPNS